MNDVTKLARCRHGGRFGGWGPWRVRVLHGTRVISAHCCWSPREAIAYAVVLQRFWPGYRVTVRRPGLRRPLIGGRS